MVRKYGMYTLLTLLSACIWIPLLMVVLQSFMGYSEIVDCFGPLFGESGDNITFRIFPQFPTLRSFMELLLDSPGFFVMFWNSCKQVFGILIGQIMVGVPAAYAFGKFSFRGKGLLQFVYMLLMILPFQVTMVSGYLVLQNLNLVNTHWAVILPGVFSTFPVFIMTKSFEGIPGALYEAAQIDGAGEWRQFVHIGVPLALPGVFSALVLGFLEYWNAIEGPMTFLKDAALWPLSLYLPNITADKMSVSFSASAVMLLPAVLLFLWGQEFLEEGISASGLKE